MECSAHVEELALDRHMKRLSLAEGRRTTGAQGLVGWRCGFGSLGRFFSHASVFSDGAV